MIGKAVPPSLRTLSVPRFFGALALSLLALAGSAPAAETPSGLPLPRFVTTRSSPTNVRLGPGVKYGIAWKYLKAGTPVEIIQEFDTWRKIRDEDGSEGWLHQNLLLGKRAGVVLAQPDGQPVGLLKSRADDSGVRAWLGANYRVDIKQCDGTWCEVVATAQSTTGSAQTYDGYLHQDALWGVYKGESFD